ncbi:glutathione S-transferase N-terminal domain-containing protein [Pseudomonadota bacterium]
MSKRFLLHALFLLVLPVIVAWFGISTAGAIALVFFALMWRWALSLSMLVAPEKAPDLELTTISASHFVEKVRWCMDRLGLEYTEKPAGGTLGAFFLGRTVPVLKFRTGAVRSQIGNSPEILRYLWGRYSAGMPDQARFLEPTTERLEFEQKIDRCGVDLQVWVYYHILGDRELTMHAWGVSNPAIPAWQRLVLKLTYPLLRFLIRKSFRITSAHHEKAVSHIEALLADVETRLSDGRKSLLGGEIINYTDLAFCAIMGLWLQPRGYGGGKADTVRIDRAQCPPQMASQIEAWSQGYPLATEFIETLYAGQRH